MDARFNELFNRPENSIFKVVFFPDRIYHAQILNATRSPRYRYYVHEVRAKLDITVLKGQVFLDGHVLTNFLRIEYRAGRLIEQAREQGRALDLNVMAWLNLMPENQPPAAGLVKMHFCRRVDAYQVEIWQTLEAPANSRHEYSVLDMMGRNGAITRVKGFSPILRDLDNLKKLELAFRENDVDLPYGYQITNPAWDNNYIRSHQEPRSSEPSSSLNTVDDKNYFIDFQRGWFIQAEDVAPVRYRNAMMMSDDPETGDDNIIEMRWLLQREFGGSVVFFHEVTIPVGTIEGTHRHIGSEELYYIVQGEGILYMGENDDPAMAHFPLEERQLFGLEKRPCRAIPVRAGSTVFTKSGGIHGIRNTGHAPLKFVAFLYHSS
ncbi:MAG: cupin domain-containing protein [Ardenticatenaceae bacterium]